MSIGFLPVWACGIEKWYSSLDDYDSKVKICANVYLYDVLFNISRIFIICSHGINENIRDNSTSNFQLDVLMI